MTTSRDRGPAMIVESSDRALRATLLKRFPVPRNLASPRNRALALARPGRRRRARPASRRSRSIARPRIRGSGSNGTKSLFQRLKRQGLLARDRCPSFARPSHAENPSFKQFEHRQSRYLNNRAEASHQPTRRRERPMQWFKSPRQAQRFLSSHSQIHNQFQALRHLLTAPDHRAARDRAFQTWRDVAGVTHAA